MYNLKVKIDTSKLLFKGTYSKKNPERRKIGCVKNLHLSQSQIKCIQVYSIKITL